MFENSRWYTIVEIAKILRVSYDTVKVKIKKIPFIALYKVDTNAGGQCPRYRMSGLGLNKFLLGLDTDAKKPVSEDE